MRPHALDDADDLSARLHDDPAAAMSTADQVLRVRLLVEVHLGEVMEAAGSEIIPASRYGSNPEPDPNPYQVGWGRSSPNPKPRPSPSPNPTQVGRGAP